jgi:hypothetical protein
MDDHAVAMARFAFECLKRFSIITKQLEPKLGPSTADLQARVGMHSGVRSLFVGLCCICKLTSGFDELTHAIVLISL